MIVETGAGAGSGLTTRSTSRLGAKIAATHADVFLRAEMIVKVKAHPVWYELLQPDQVLFTYLHLAAEESLTWALMERKSPGGRL